MEIAIVMNADSQVGAALCQRLVHLGYTVYGLGEDFSKNILKHQHYQPVKCPLGKPEAIDAFLEHIHKKEMRISSILMPMQLCGDEEAAALERYMIGPWQCVRGLLPKLFENQGHLIWAPIIESDFEHPSHALIYGAWERFLQSTHKKKHAPQLSALIIDHTDSVSDAKAASTSVEELLSFRMGGMISELRVSGAPSGSLAENEVVLPTLEYFPPEEPLIPTEEPTPKKAKPRRRAPAKKKTTSTTATPEKKAAPKKTATKKVAKKKVARKRVSKKTATQE